MTLGLQTFLGCSTPTCYWSLPLIEQLPNSILPEGSLGGGTQASSLFAVCHLLGVGEAVPCRDALSVTEGTSSPCRRCRLVLASLRKLGLQDKLFALCPLALLPGSG